MAMTAQEQLREQEEPEVLDPVQMFVSHLAVMRALQMLGLTEWLEGMEPTEQQG
jgi:hypothetical protein